MEGFGRRRRIGRGVGGGGRRSPARRLGRRRRRRRLGAQLGELLRLARADRARVVRCGRGRPASCRVGGASGAGPLAWLLPIAVLYDPLERCGGVCVMACHEGGWRRRNDWGADGASQLVKLDARILFVRSARARVLGGCFFAANEQQRQTSILILSGQASLVGLPHPLFSIQSEHRGRSRKRRRQIAASKCARRPRSRSTKRQTVTYSL